MSEPQTAKSIFLSALDISAPDEQREYIAKRCGDDEQLRAEVLTLLRHHGDLGSFLESGSTEPPRGETVPERAGTMVGDYKLLEQIGEGGMGVVYMAEQLAPVRRKVAVKLIKPGMDTGQVIARFEAERQALAVMDHPGIARVLDAGATPSGHPYFVMELVRGVPITTYCNQHKLSIRERLELFAAVCHAIQHAHGKGILHRDIKPTNVLVTRQDGRPVVKVIDFGVAKAMGRSLTDKTLFTHFAQVVGTPLYMSPEQAERSGVDIDTRSDVFSLGVLLYELLTGTTPVTAEQLQQAAFDEIRRIICEQDPPTPSARISGSHTLPEIAADRHVEPARLTRLVRGELDWIVMKALDKDRNRRYETADAFAADVRHYLEDEPVLACPPSAAYRFRKFARRHRVALSTAALVALALGLGTVVSTWQAVRAETARAAEADQRKVAERARAAEALQRQAAETQRLAAEKSRAAAEANYQQAKAAVDKYFTLVSESTLFDVPGLQPLRKDLLESALEFYEGAARDRSNDPAVLAETAATYLRVSSVYLALNRADDFIAAIDRALNTVDELRREHPDAAEHELKLAGFWKGSRWTQVGMELPRDFPAAMRTMLRLEETWQQMVERHPAEIGFKGDLSYVRSTIGAGLTSAGQRDKGTEYFRQALALNEQVVAAAPNSLPYRSDQAEVLSLLARNVVLKAGGAKESQELMRRAIELGEGLVAASPDVPTYRANLAQALLRLAEQNKREQPEAARASVQRATELATGLIQQFQGHQPYVEQWRHGVVLGAELDHAADGDVDIEAMVAQITQAFESQIALRPRDRLLREAYAVYCLEAAAKSSKAPALAEQLYRRAIETDHALLSDFADQPEDWKLKVEWHAGKSYRSHGDFARSAGRPSDALEHFVKATSTFQRLAAVDPEHEASHRAMMADAMLQQAGLLVQAGRSDEAHAAGRQAFDTYDALLRAFPAEAEYRLSSFTAIQAFVAQLATAGRLSEAESTARQAVGQYAELAAAYPDVPDFLRFQAGCQRHLAQIQDAAHQASATTYDEAIATYRRVLDVHPKYADLWRVYHGLALSLDAIGRNEDAAAALRQAVDRAPDNAAALNTLAWQLATNERHVAGDPKLAVALAERALALEPQSAMIANTLGVAHYRAENWQAALDALTKSMQRQYGGNCHDWIFASMAHAKLGHDEEARRWYEKAVGNMEVIGANAELRRFQEEAAALLALLPVAGEQSPDGKTPDAPSP